MSEDEPPLHDVLRLLDEIKIDMPLFGNAVAPMPQLDRVDGLGNEGASHPRRDCDRNDQRDNDRVIAGHFEDHDDRCHDAAGSRADHRGHADDCG